MVKQFQVIRLEQNDRVVFVGVLTAAQVLGSLTKVDAWTGTGYQRVENDEKIDDLSDFLSKRWGILPTSLLVGVRDPNSKFVPVSGSIGLLQIANPEKLYLVDGQHRVKGLNRAIKGHPRIKRLKNFSFPTVFICPLMWNPKNTAEIEEGKQFVTINEKQTPVKKDLADAFVYSLAYPFSLIHKYNLEGLSQDVIEMLPAIVKAREVTIQLRGHTSQHAAWKGKISPPNQPKKGALVTEKVFGDPLKKYIMADPDYLEMQPDILASRLEQYWQAILEYYPGAKAQPKRFWVQKGLGVPVFLRVFPLIDRRVPVPVTESYLTTLQAELRMPGARFWGRRGRARKMKTSYTARDEVLEMMEVLDEIRAMERNAKERARARNQISET